MDTIKGSSVKLIICSAIFALLTSCSTKWNDLFESENPDKRNKKLMKSFGAEEDVFEKFTENKDAEPEEAPKEELAPEKKSEVVKKEEPKAGEPKPEEAKQEEAKQKEPVTKTEPKQTSKQASATASPKAPVQAKVVTVAPKRFPEDYPEDVKKIGEKAAKLWSMYTPIFYPGETIVMDINYMGISTGKIVLTTEKDTVIGEESVYHAKAKVKTSDYYSYLYELDDNVDSFVSKRTLLPVKYSMIQRESGQDVDDLQLFEQEKLKVHSFYQRVTEDKTKKKKREKYTPTHFTDPLGVVWFLRGLPMDQGKSFSVPIINKGKIIMLEATNEGLVTLNTKIGEKKAYKMKATTSYTGETLKSGDMTFWFSADDKRVFLKFEAKIKIGSISGEIEKYEQ